MAKLVKLWELKQERSGEIHVWLFWKVFAARTCSVVKSVSEVAGASGLL